MRLEQFRDEDGFVEVILLNQSVSASNLKAVILRPSSLGYKGIGRMARR